MEFVAVLKPDDKCKLGCFGTGILRRMRVWPDKKASAVETICACCKVTVLSKDPDEALEKLAELTGRKLRMKDIVTPSEYLEDIKDKLRG